MSFTMESVRAVATQANEHKKFQRMQQLEERFGELLKSIFEAAQNGEYKTTIGVASADVDDLEWMLKEKGFGLSKWSGMYKCTVSWY